MREIPLTNGGVAVVDDSDFDRLAGTRWQRHPLGYAYRCETRRAVGRRVVFLMHRVVVDAPKGLYVDHINGQRADNRRSNLRICTHSQNLANRARQRNNGGSRYKGVTFSGQNLKKPWRARCGRKEAGWFATEDEAALAYNCVASALYGEFAVLNDIQAKR